MTTFKVIKGRNLLIIAIVLVVLVTTAVTVNVAMASGKKLPVYSTDSADKIAISFDASWGADKTRKIIEVLSSYGVTATFFLTGLWIDAFPEEVKYIAESGFEIGNHSRNHYNMTGLNAKKIGEELDYVNQKVYELTGQQPKTFRAPFGAYDNKLIELVEKRGMTCVQWSIDSLDWKGISGEEIKKRIIPALKGGEIILCHNNGEHTVEALEGVIEAALSKGLRFVRMSDMIYSDNYTIDANGKQIKNSNGGDI